MTKKAIINLSCVGLSYLTGLAICFICLPTWASQGPRIVQVLKASIVLPFQVVLIVTDSSGVGPILVLLGLCCVPIALWVTARIRRSTGFAVAGHVACGFLWNFLMWLGCLLSGLD